MRAIDARNAFVMNSLLQEVTRSGTAASAKRALGRGDIFGKTGTTNDSMDAWFAGFHPSLVAVVWIGYDTPRKLGDRETGGGLALPVWIEYMAHALKGVPVQELTPPEGVIQADGDWSFEEFSQGRRRAQPGPGGRAAAAAHQRRAQQHPRPVPATEPPQRRPRSRSRQRCAAALARACALAWRDSASKNSLPSRVSSQRPCTWR